MTDAAAVFLPWLRSGVAARLAVRDEPGATLTNAAKLSVALDVTGVDATPVSLRPYGPGDVTGLDPRQIVRCEPPDGTTTFESNHFAAVELDAPELPWLFTPAAASKDGRLRPWLVLVVVEEQPGIAIEERGEGRPPVLRIDAPAVPAAELPDLAESWAWAHAQILDAPPAVDDTLLHRPAATLSRLLAPRRLAEQRRYHACLVPAFRAGRQAGLGVPVDGPDRALQPAWNTQAGPDATRIELPLYHHWRFGTADGGDFRSLARKLRPARLPAGAGTRPLTIPSLNGDGATEVPFEGALSPTGSMRAPLPDPAWAEAARKRIDVDDDTVAPPRYGAWYVDEPVRAEPAAARSARLPADGQGVAWFRELNLDPRDRAAAGLGARVVDRVREQLVAEAFRQAADTGTARTLHERARLAVAVGQSVLARHLAPLPADRLLSITAPAHAQLRVAPAPAGGPRALPTGSDGDAPTIDRSLRDNGYPTAAVSPAFRRLVRPGGLVGELLAVRGTVLPAADLAAAVGRVRQGDGLTTRAPGLATLAAAGLARATPDALAAAAPRPAWVPAAPGDPVTSPADGADSAAAQRFREAAQAHLAVLGVPADPLPAGPIAARTEDADLRLRLLGTLDPRAAAAQRLGARIAPDGATPRALGVAAQAPELREPPAVRPVIRRAMVTALNDISPRLLLPGVAAIAPETVSVAVTNPRFIEAFMVGLNHEANRVLLWRGVPVDRRAMPFQQFWRYGDEEPAELSPIDEWQPESGLGEHLLEAPADAPGGSGMILVARGELFRRHPGTTVYARRALWSSDGTRVLAGAVPGGSTDTPEDNAYPRVHGRVGADALLVGLFVDSAGNVLDEAAVRGADDASGDAGWFFVLQEHPAEPRFGLATDRAAEPPPRGSWQDLSWADLPDGTARYVPAAGAAPDTSWVTASGGATWGATAADMALITLRRPYRSAVHARVFVEPTDPRS